MASFLLAYVLSLAWMRPVNMLDKLTWQEIKDSLQPITQWKQKVASGQQQPANEDPESYGLQGPEFCQHPY